MGLLRLLYISGWRTAQQERLLVRRGDHGVRLAHGDGGPIVVWGRGDSADGADGADGADMCGRWDMTT